MSIGNLIDKLYDLRQQRLDLQKQVDALKEQETALRQAILFELDMNGLAKASGSHATAGVTLSIQPSVEDWDAVYEFIQRNQRFDLLQKRLSTTAWRELVDEGVHVPGTFVMEVRDISLTKSVRG
jgi:hypothetical protein